MGVTAGLLTVTVTLLLVVLRLALLVATAVKTWEPLTLLVVSQLTLYGAVVTAVPRFSPSSLYWTLVMAWVPPAVAVTAGVLPLTVALAVGVVIETVGAVGLLTVTVTLLLVVVNEALLVATAVKVCEPLVVVAVFQATL